MKNRESESSGRTPMKWAIRPARLDNAQEAIRWARRRSDIVVMEMMMMPTERGIKYRWKARRRGVIMGENDPKRCERQPRKGGIKAG